MAINIDSDDTNADWMRTRTWDLPRTAKALILNIGADRWEHFKTLPAFKAIPAGLEHDVDQYLSVQHLGVVKYNESQERDAHGRFGSGGSSSDAGTKPLPSDKKIEQWEMLADQDENVNKNLGVPELRFAYEHYGMDAKPTVSDEEFQKLKDEGATIVYRGVSRDSLDGISPQEITDQFRYGDKHYAGFGYDATGTYTSENSGTAKEYALAWDNTPEGGAVMEMALKPDSKFIESDDLTEKVYSEIVTNSKYNDMQKVWLSDPSNAAMHFGYDGIRIENGNSANKEDYYVILNRAAVVMPTKDLTWTA